MTSTFLSIQNNDNKNAVSSDASWDFLTSSSPGLCPNQHSVRARCVDLDTGSELASRACGDSLEAWARVRFQLLEYSTKNEKATCFVVPAYRGHGSQVSRHFLVDKSYGF